LADATKHDILLNDILHIETQILVLKNNFKDALERNRELEGYLNELKKENLELKQKISEIEEELQNQDINSFSSLNLKEREALKIKLQNLISRIDYHLSS
jgi:predicted RNase H-like nuclease (RuvC/YqgF family)